MDYEPEFIKSMGRGVWIDDNPTKVESALKRGFDPNYYDNDGATTIHRVAESGCVNALRVFLNHDITRTDVKDHMGQSPLHYAAKCTNFGNALEATQLLLAAGIDIDIESNNTDVPTALFIAIHQKNIKLAEYLLEHGADVDMTNFSDATLILKLVVDNTHYTDDELVTFASLLLYYNVDVNWPFNTHPLLLALLVTRKCLIELLVNYFAGYDFFLYSNPDFDYNTALTKTIKYSIRINLKYDEIVYILDNFKFNEFDNCTIFRSLVKSVRYADFRLFNYLYCKLRKPVKIQSCGILLHNFFVEHKFKKHEFILACERLLELDIGLVWREDPNGICFSNLFLKQKDKLNLSQNEMENIIYQMLPFANTIYNTHLFDIFNKTGFSYEFEIFLKHNPLIYVSTVSSSLGHPEIHDKRRLFNQICFPSWQKLNPKPSRVLNLRRLSRDVIRKHLHPKYPLTEGPHYLFQYYNRVQKLPVPQVVKDIITMKVLV